MKAAESVTPRSRTVTYVLWRAPPTENLGSDRGSVLLSQRGHFLLTLYIVERQLVAIEQLTEQVREADEDLEQIAVEDETCQRLMTVPGVGPGTGVRFPAAIDVR